MFNHRVPVIVVDGKRVLGDAIWPGYPRVVFVETIVRVGRNRPDLALIFGRRRVVLREALSGAVPGRLLDLPGMRVRELHAGRHLADARFRAHRDLQRAFGHGRSALREDLHHPIGPVRAVHRGRRRSLDDLDALDVLGRDVGDAVARDHPVDDVQRIRPARDAGRAPQAKCRFTPRRSGLRHKAHTRDFPLDSLQRVGARDRLQLVFVHGAHGEAELASIGRVSHTSNDDFLEPQRVGLQREVLTLRAGRKRDRR